MKIISEMNKIELRCEICSAKFDSNYNIPKVMSCGHTVCSKCVERLREKSLNRCPFDRKILDFDDDKIAINYYILSLVEQSTISGSTLHLSVEEEVLELNPRPVINSPGWKNTLDGFIKDDVLFTVETNGFIYCTDLNTGEWWFMYHNQFFGNFFFRLKEEGANKMYLIDQYGSLYQIFNKNYYVQIGRKNAWRNTTHLTVYNNKIYTIESSNKFYETNLHNGKWKEIVIRKEHFDASSSGEDFYSEMEAKLFKNVSMLISTKKSILFSNKNGEVYSFMESTGETRLVKNDFFKNIESYSANTTHVYFIEKNSKIIYRAVIISEEDEKDKDPHSTTTFEETINKLDTDRNSKVAPKRVFLETEVFVDFDQQNQNIFPIKVIADEKKLVVIDKTGDINVFTLQGPSLLPFPLHSQSQMNTHSNSQGIVPYPNAFPIKTFQCLFMLRNCHLMNTAIIGDGDLLLLDPIRLSLNKLNILAGTEVIILHSNKFLYSIKNIFTTNSRIYFIDVPGNLYYFNELDKKLTQIGNNGICKYILDFAVHKNFILTIENNTLYKTNLNDGNYIEIKNEYCKNYEHFFADNMSIIFINKSDEINVLNLNASPLSKNSDKMNNKLPGNSDTSLKDQLVLKTSFTFKDISKACAITYFKNNLIFYNKETESIDAINLETQIHKKMVESFPEVNLFINNSDFLACILRDGVIYKLYC